MEFCVLRSSSIRSLVHLLLIKNRKSEQLCLTVLNWIFSFYFLFAKNKFASKNILVASF